MADSDEEYDRKKRDKFRRERSDYTSERRRNDHDRRSTWREEYSDSRKRSRDDDDDKDTRGGRYHHGGGSPPPGRRGGDWSPSNKRFRREGWESLRNYGHGGMMPGFHMMERRPPPWMMGGEGPHGGGGMPMPPSGPRGMGGDMMMGFTSMNDSRQRGSTLLTFKQFLGQQDDNIDDSDAIRLYHEYKADFKKKQLHQFFNDHKEEDWLLAKYHPKRVAENHSKHLDNVSSRASVFEWFHQQGDVPLVVSEGEQIIRFMDKAVILMEGGSENDFQALDTPPQTRSPSVTKKIVEKKESIKDEDSSKSSFSVPELSPEHQVLADQAKQYRNDVEQDSQEPVNERKRTRDEGSSSPEETKKPHTGNEDEPHPSVSNDDVATPSPDKDTDPAKESQPEEEVMTTTQPMDDTEEDKEQKTTCDEEQTDVPPVDSGPRHLHLTKAVYIRHIPPQLSAADILEVCQSIPGYLRLAFAEPLPERSYERRGWVTYSADTNIMSMTARIASAKIKGVQLNCQVNKDLSRRVKPVVPITWARGVVVHDIQQLMKIIEVLDKKGQLWQHRVKEDKPVTPSEEDKTSKDGEGGEDDGIMETPENDDTAIQDEPIKTNPFSNLPESLFELESSPRSTDKSMNGAGGGEGGNSDDDGAIGDDEDEEGVISDPNTTILTLDSRLIKVLDQLLWYVRIVHSLDYYSFSHFVEEDHMPHRLGIMSARPKPPQAIVVSSEEVAEHIKHVNEKVAPLLVEKKELSEEEMEKLGRRDQDTELEKFIDANTQKLGENKYLCPLSGKKFRGPDFVRKHIFNKHKEALEEVKSDTEYFNNYLRDPDRPVPLDGSTVIGFDEGRGKGEESRQPQRGWGNPDMMMGPGYHGPRFERGGSRGQRRYSRPPRESGFGGGGNRGKRRLLNYEDLDAPVDLY